MIFTKIKKCVNQALEELNLPSNVEYLIQQTKNIKFGDFSSNIAMVLSKIDNKNPEEIANQIIGKINPDEFEKITFSKPGFINFFLSNTDKLSIIKELQNQDYEINKLPENERDSINIEFVSANPTGFLHLGHVRNAFTGDVLGNILKAVGHNVTKEYWINDLGNQVNLFALSSIIRYLEKLGVTKYAMPEDSYHGKEPIFVADEIIKDFGDKYKDIEIVDNKIVDQKIANELIEYCTNKMLHFIKQDLALIGVNMDVWTSEKVVYQSNTLQALLDNQLKDHIYNKDGAVWLKTTDGGDDKDRVIFKENKAPTYFGTDIANHYLKYKRGFNRLINVWGADHFGHVLRTTYAAELSGVPKGNFIVVLIEMVKLLQNNKEIKFSKRLGNAISIPDMLEFLSKDAARWFMLNQSWTSGINIDVDISNKKDSSNPVYYVQYAHARIHKLLTKIDQIDFSKVDLSLLNSDIERTLINHLASFEYYVHNVATTYDVNKLLTFVYTLAKNFHSWYNSHEILNQEDNIKYTRLALAKSIKILINYLLKLFGISAPEQM
ncbi:arginine--tRNA ligase [Mycoplasma sp. T363T]|uniref:arginine--tRNA ligase n=1 Tax=Mycoplasma bradburyae TaxID=2963128 RepID=UPI002341129C|nr:arginine--tRNA ligase [Mycoplasma bradburyae]MDC4163225.1 arginine--tRNA ligase [Mycoplasma bradburyae]